MRTIKDIKAQGNIVSWFVGVAIAVIIALSVAWPVIDGALNGGAYARGTFTFTGNSTTGQYVNITKEDGSVMCYYFNTTGIGKPVGCLVVDVRSGGNTSVISATNLTTAINGDTDLDGILTATNPSSSVTVVTSDRKTQLLNQYALSDTVTNGAWGATHMSGGITDASAMPVSAQTIILLVPLFLALLILMLFIRPLL